jgi:prevent-host-death family protein
MHTISLFDAKTHLSRIVESLLAGKDDQVVIARRGKPVARLIPLAGADVSQRIGLAKGRFKIPEDSDSANKQIAALFSKGSGAS